MRNLNEHTITDAVVARFADTPDPRIRQIMTSLVRHLHSFARDVRLTEDEWMRGIEFLTATGSPLSPFTLQRTRHGSPLAPFATSSPCA